MNGPALVIVGRDARTLEEIAESIRVNFGRGTEAQFAIGHDLAEARAQFPSDPEYGQWLREQGFPFSTEWGRTLRLAAENEPAVRGLLATQVASGSKPNIKKAVKTVLQPAEVVPIEEALARLDEPATGAVTFRDLLQLLGAIEALKSIDAGHFAAIVPPRRQDSTASRLRKAGSILARVAFRLEGTEWQ
jgi:hypothetical protein